MPPRIGGNMAEKEGINWGSLFEKGIDYYVQLEQQDNQIQLEEKRIAASNPVFVRNEDNRTVRAGTASGFMGGIPPVAIVAALGVVVLLVFALRR